MILMRICPREFKYTVFLSFDLDAESAEVYMKRDPVSMSFGRYSVKIGVKKILEVLGDHGLKVTFFTPGWVVEKYSDVVGSILGDGHEVALHGYLHEKLDQLELEEELLVFKKSISAFERILDFKPKGFRAPYWRFSGNTLNILFEEGFLYDSSLMDDEKPYILEHNGRKIVELPVDWRLDDWPHLEIHRLPPRMLLEMWMEELDYAARNNGFLSLTMHPSCISRGARIRVLTRILGVLEETEAWTPKGCDLASRIIELLGK